jgi:hypothetical protein
VENILERRSSFRLAVCSTTQLQIAPLYEIGKTVGLGLDLQIVDHGLGPVGTSQQYPARTGFQEPIEELLKVPLYVYKQWLASAQSARERQKRRVTAQAEKYPKERQFMANQLLRGTG